MAFNVALKTDTSHGKLKMFALDRKTNAFVVDMFIFVVLRALLRCCAEVLISVKLHVQTNSYDVHQWCCSFGKGSNDPHPLINALGGIPRALNLFQSIIAVLCLPLFVHPVPGFVFCLVTRTSSVQSVVFCMSSVWLQVQRSRCARPRGLRVRAGASRLLRALGACNALETGGGTYLPPQDGGNVKKA